MNHDVFVQKAIEAVRQLPLESWKKKPREWSDHPNKFSEFYAKTEKGAEVSLETWNYFIERKLYKILYTLKVGGFKVAYHIVECEKEMAGAWKVIQPLENEDDFWLKELWDDIYAHLNEQEQKQVFNNMLEVYEKL